MVGKFNPKGTIRACMWWMHSHHSLSPRSACIISKGRSCIVITALWVGVSWIEQFGTTGGKNFTDNALNEIHFRRRRSAAGLRKNGLPTILWNFSTAPYLHLSGGGVSATVQDCETRPLTITFNFLPNRIRLGLFIVCSKEEKFFSQVIVTGCVFREGVTEELCNQDDDGAGNKTEDNFFRKTSFHFRTNKVHPLQLDLQFD